MFNLIKTFWKKRFLWFRCIWLFQLHIQKLLLFLMRFGAMILAVIFWFKLVFGIDVQGVDFLSWIEIFLFLISTTLRLRTRSWTLRFGSFFDCHLWASRNRLQSLKLTGLYQLFKILHFYRFGELLSVILVLFRDACSEFQFFFDFVTYWLTIGQIRNLRWAGVFLVDIFVAFRRNGFVWKTLFLNNTDRN